MAHQLHLFAALQMSAQSWKPITGTAPYQGGYSSRSSNHQLSGLPYTAV